MRNLLSFCKQDNLHIFSGFPKEYPIAEYYTCSLFFDVASWPELVHRIMGSLGRMLVGNRPVLSGERYLTDKEVSAQLKLSRRTLQENYRKAYMSSK